MTIEPRLLADEAAQLISPSGEVTARFVADEMRKGTLASERLGRKRYTTQTWIREWLRKCREKDSRRASTSGSAPGAKASGSSSTLDERSAQAAALAIAKQLTKRSATTSSTNGARLAHQNRRAS